MVDVDYRDGCVFGLLTFWVCERVGVRVRVYNYVDFWMCVEYGHISVCWVYMPRSRYREYNDEAQLPHVQHQRPACTCAWE